MPRDPQSRTADDGAQPAGSNAPEEVVEPDRKQEDEDWLSMATADPALFLKDSGAE